MPILGFNRQSFPDKFTQVGRAMYGSLNARQLNARAAVSVPLVPMLPLIVAGGAMLYHQGNEATKPNGGDKNAWLNILLESAIGTWVLKNTTGLYPLFGLGLAAYRSGQKHTAQEKVQAMVNTGICMLLGWAGVHLFESFAEAGRANDDHIIKNALKGEGKHEAKFKKWVDTHLTNLATSNEDAKGLKDALAELGTTYKDQDALYAKTGKYGGKPEWEVLEPFRNKIMELKSNIAERVEKIGAELFSTVEYENKSAVRAALAKIEDSQSSFTRFNRAMNPIYGYIITGLVIGTPLAKWISSKIGEKRPDLKTKQFHANVFPHENRIINYTVGSGGHGGGHGANHFMAPGPAIVWPEANGGRPMQ